MTTLTFGTRLNAQSWANALSELPARYSDADYSDKGLLGERLVVDLRHVGFADFVTLGHLLMLVRATSQAGADCSVRLPRTSGSPAAVALDSDAATRRIRRHNCRLYLQQTGVVEALGRVIAPDSDWDEESPAEPGDDDWPRVPRSDPPHRARRILRYRWMPADAAQSGTLPSTVAELERTWRELGLSAEASAAVTRGITHELLENAERHSGAREILLGGVIVDPETYGTRSGDFEPALRDFAEHAAVERSALVRLVVADAGCGMAAHARDAKLGEFIIRALDSRSGTAGSVQTDAAQGLWKASRVVRAHEGTLLISSRGHVAGRVYEPGAVKEASRPAPTALPGTFVECAVLTSPRSEVIATAGELITPPRRAGRGEHGLQCVAAPLCSPDGLRGEDRDRVRAALDDLPSDATGLVLVINLPHADGTHDVDIGRAIAGSIDIAAEHDAHTVTLAFPSANRSLMSVAVEYLNAKHDELASAEAPGPAPVLVLAPNKRHYWVGGTAAQRRALGRLSSADAPVLAPPAAPWNDDETAAIDDLCRRTALLDSGEATITLRTLPQDAITAMAQWAGAEIERAVARPTDADRTDVWPGPFLTPTLRVTDRWFDLTSLLSRLDLQAVAGMSLAALVEDELLQLDLPAPPSIRRMVYAPVEMFSTFNASLTGRRDDGLLHGDRADKDTAPQPGPVILVADAISSGTTMARALADALQQQLKPVAVAAVLDTRPADERQADPSYLDLPSGKVPLISLGSVTVDAEPTGTPMLIDPVLRRPEIGRRPAPSQLIPQPEYVKTMQRNTAARLGHIARPADRHYTAYVDPTLLFREEEWLRTILANLTAEIEARHRSETDAVDATLCILYPERTADDLTAAAALLQKALKNAGLHLAGEPVAVPRAAHAANWQLPSSFALPTMQHAVILDSGASTGRTVQQLISLAADEDVATITAVLLLNGMSDSDAVNLQRITTVRRSVATDRASVKVIYVAKTAMGHVPGRHCAICALRRRYESVRMNVPIPEALAKHHEWLLWMLQPRTKQESFEEQAADLFGANVSQPECVGYLSWRLLLREAALNTERRQDAVERLKLAANDRVVRDSLVRLLVAESQWLDSAPLWFPECRAIIAELAASMLVDNQAMLIEQRLRAQAATLLAQTDPDRFARNLSGILRMNRRQGLVVVHILLETLSLISDPRGAALHSRRPVIRHLVESLNDIQDLLRNPGDGLQLATEFLTLPLVRYLLSHAVRSLREPPTDAQSAWAALRAEFRTASHDYANGAWMARTVVQFADAGEEVKDPERIRDGWSSCANYLLDKVLPNVQPLRQILLSKVVLGDLPRELGVRWERTLASDDARAVDETTVRVDDLVDRLQQHERPDASQTRELVADLDWWLKFVLDSHEGLLPRFIARAPVDAVEVVRNTFVGHAFQIDYSRLAPTHRLHFMAFCTNRLLKDVFSHVLMNAQKDHRIEGQEQQFRVELEESDPEHLTITVFNDASTRKSSGRRAGLDTVRHRLERFNGAIEDFDPGDPWTYAVAVRLERWKADS